MNNDIAEHRNGRDRTCTYTPNYIYNFYMCKTVRLHVTLCPFQYTMYLLIRVLAEHIERVHTIDASDSDMSTRQYNGTSTDDGTRTSPYTNMAVTKPIFNLEEQSTSGYMSEMENTVNSKSASEQPFVKG